jgi:hypothetical protein
VLNKSNKPRGGARPNSGPKKGAIYKKTLDKIAAREAMRAAIAPHMAKMVQRMVVAALGFGHLYTRDKAGKFSKVESQAEIDRLLAEGEEDRDYWIFTKDPSVQAFTDLANRYADKPKEQEMEIRVSGALELVAARLIEARKRLANR